MSSFSFQPNHYKVYILFIFTLFFFDVEEDLIGEEVMDTN